jgi:protein-disulfide isomerase
VTAGGGAVIAVLLIAIVVSVATAARNPPADGAAAASDTPPAGATPAGALAVGDAAAPVTVELYLDYMCPFCGRFERANGAELERLVAAGTVRLELYPLSFLDRMSAGSRYSTRAANAVATVADRTPDTLLAVHAALFANQPDEGSRGLSDDDIAGLARRAGVSQQVTDAFDDRAFEGWIAGSTEEAFAGGITGTPTVKINGTVFPGDLYTVGPLTQAIGAAASR